MIEKMRGYSIVELLVVIAALGILATIGIMSYNGYTTSTRDKVRENDVRAWVNSFNLYKSRYAVWPAMPDSPSSPKRVCLGSPYVPDGHSAISSCGQYTGSNQIAASGTDFNDLSTRLATMGNVPKNTGPPIDGGCCSVTGPLVSLSQTTTAGVTTVTGRFIAFFESKCPTGFTNMRTQSTSDNLQGTVFQGMPASPGTNPGPPYPCGIEEQFTYTGN